jgi:hypothetical protein
VRREAAALQQWRAAFRTGLRLSARRPPLSSSLGCRLHRENDAPWLFEI